MRTFYFVRLEKYGQYGLVFKRSPIRAPLGTAGIRKRVIRAQYGPGIVYLRSGPWGGGYTLAPTGRAGICPDSPNRNRIFFETLSSCPELFLKIFRNWTGQFLGNRCPTLHEHRAGPISFAIDRSDQFFCGPYNGGRGLPLIPLYDRSPRPFLKTVGSIDFEFDRTDHPVSSEHPVEAHVITLEQKRCPRPMCPTNICAARGVGTTLDLY